MNEWKTLVPSPGMWGRKILLVGKFLGDGPARWPPHAKQRRFLRSEELPMMFPADSGFGRFQGCFSALCGVLNRWAFPSGLVEGRRLDACCCSCLVIF